MGKINNYPQTFLGHPHHFELKILLQRLFADPDPAHIGKEILSFLETNSLAIDEFPHHSGKYTRTILHRSENGFEAMVARWSKGAVSTVHGHPFFSFYCVTQGRLEIDNFNRCGDRVVKTTSENLSSSEHFTFTGKTGTFDNNIHQVRAIEETLSIHISSDDSTKGEVFCQF